MSRIRTRVLRALAAFLVAGSGVFAVDRAALAAPQQAESDKTSIDGRLKRVAADIFAGTTRVDEDIAELKAILAVDPRSAQAHMLLGVAYRTKGSPDLLGEAAGELRQAIQLDPSLAPARLYLAHLYLDLARPERAKAELQAALEQIPGQPQFLALLGEAERQLGDAKGALDMTGRALEASPDSAEARYYQGLALYDLGRRDEAISEFEQVVKSGGRRPEVYSSLGTAYIDAGRLDDAIANLIDAIKLDPTRPEPMIYLARAFRLKGELSKAEAPLTHARSIVGPTSLSGADQRIQRDLSFEEGLLRLQLKQLEAAARSLRKVVDLDSSYGPGHRYLAEVYIRQGLFAKAQDQALRGEKLGSPLPADLQKTLDDKLRAARPKGRG